MTDSPEEYPTSDELPDDPPDPEDIDPFNVDDADFDNIDEFARAELKSQTTKDDQ